jgi:hypothetical protein
MATSYGLIAFATVTLFAAGCAPGADDTTPESANTISDAVDSPDGDQPKAPEAGCKNVELKARPIAVSHFQDPNLHQTAGTLSLRIGGAWQPTLMGAVLATIVGQDADGTLRGNHHFLFKEGVLRTQNDKVVMAPTADPCVFDASTEIYVVDGTKSFQGYTGTLTGVGKVNFCGDPGLIAIQGKLCR